MLDSWQERKTRKRKKDLMRVDPGNRGAMGGKAGAEPVGKAHEVVTEKGGMTTPSLAECCFVSRYLFLGKKRGMRSIGSSIRKREGDWKSAARKDLFGHVLKGGKKKHMPIAR